MSAADCGLERRARAKFGSAIWLRPFQAGRCMHSLGDLAKALNRPMVYFTGLQARFELPVLLAAGYSEAYLAFLKGIVHLRTLNVSEEALRDLWKNGKARTSLRALSILSPCSVQGRERLLSNY